MHEAGSKNKIYFIPGQSIVWNLLLAYIHYVKCNMILLWHYESIVVYYLLFIYLFAYLFIIK